MENQSSLNNQEPRSSDFHDELVYLRKGIEIVVPNEKVPNVREFVPKKQEYQSPQELVEEFRNFIRHDVEEGEVIGLRYKHAFQMAPEGEKKLNAEIQNIEKKEDNLAGYDREDIMSLLVKEIGVDLMILGGELLL